MQHETPRQYKLIGIAMEMGYLIAVPLVGLALLGAFLDKAFNTKPLLLLFSILFAIIISSVLVYRKTKEMIDDAEVRETTPQDTESKKL